MSRRQGVVRALIGGPAPSYVPFTTEPAVFSFLSSELHLRIRMGHRSRFGEKGSCRRKRQTKPSYEVTLSANFTGTDNLCLFNPRSSSSPEAAKSLVARMVIDSYSEATHTSSSR
jgi:hypothetical protein